MEKVFARVWFSSPLPVEVARTSQSPFPLSAILYKQHFMTDILYKYRTTDNFKNFVDILLNNRLYAAKYDTLNDPMEGHYLYNDGILDRTVLELIYSQKQQLKLCSLSKSPDVFLLWSHYANGHRGVVFGVRIDETKYPVNEIEYLSDLTIVDRFDNMTTRNILSKKLNFWNYEEEVRVFTENGNYIEVVVEKLIIGKQMSDQEYGFIRKLVEKINPQIEISRQL